MEELRDIAKKIIPEADYADIINNSIRLSWKTNDDPERPNKRFQPVIIEIQYDRLNPYGINSGELPDNVSPEIGKEFAAFVREKRAQFNPRTTKYTEEPHTPENWVFPPET